MNSLKESIKNQIRKILAQEGVSFTNTSKELDRVITDLKKHFSEWKAAKPEDKKKHLDVMKQLTIKKKQLEKELHDSIINIDKDVQLKVTADMAEE